MYVKSIKAPAPDQNWYVLTIDGIPAYYARTKQAADFIGVFLQFDHQREKCVEHHQHEPPEDIGRYLFLFADGFKKKLDEMEARKLVCRADRFYQTMSLTVDRVRKGRL